MLQFQVRTIRGKNRKKRGDGGKRTGRREGMEGKEQKDRGDGGKRTGRREGMEGKGQEEERGWREKDRRREGMEGKEKVTTVDYGLQAWEPRLIFVKSGARVV